MALRGSGIPCERGLENPFPPICARKGVFAVRSLSAGDRPAWNTGLEGGCEGSGGGLEGVWPGPRAGSDRPRQGVRVLEIGRLFPGNPPFPPAPAMFHAAPRSHDGTAGTGTPIPIAGA